MAMTTRNRRACLAGLHMVVSSFSGNGRILREAEEHPEATGGTTGLFHAEVLLEIAAAPTVYLPWSPWEGNPMGADHDEKVTLPLFYRFRTLRGPAPAKGSTWLTRIEIMALRDNGGLLFRSDADTCRTPC